MTKTAHFNDGGGCPPMALGELLPSRKWEGAWRVENGRRGSALLKSATNGGGDSQETRKGGKPGQSGALWDG